jgi:hypothetical protein
MANRPEVISPFIVFVSSSITEFGKLRENLKKLIDAEKFAHSLCRPMKAVLIEHERGPVISENIKKALKNCSLYIGIFGYTYSEWTIAEYREARSMGLPLLIYHVKKRRGRGRPSRMRRKGRKSKVEHFLESEVKKAGIRIRGPYWKEEELLDDILEDLAYEVVELVKEATSVRRLIHERLPPL